MSKRWITAVVATAIAGSTLGFVLSETTQPPGETAHQKPAGAPAKPTAATVDAPAAPATPAANHATVQAQPIANSGRQALEAYQREYEGSGTSVSLLGNLEVGKRYRIEGDLSIGRSTSVSAVAYAYLYVEDSNGRGQYLSLGQRNTRGGSWSRLQHDVQLPAGPLRRAELLLLATQRSQSLFIDNVSVTRL